MWQEVFTHHLDQKLAGFADDSAEAQPELGTRTAKRKKPTLPPKDSKHRRRQSSSHTESRAERETKAPPEVVRIARDDGDCPRRRHRPISGQSWPSLTTPDPLTWGRLTTIGTTHVQFKPNRYEIWHRLIRSARIHYRPSRTYRAFPWCEWTMQGWELTNCVTGFAKRRDDSAGHLGLEKKRVEKRAKPLPPPPRAHWTTCVIANNVEIPDFSERIEFQRCLYVVLFSFELK